MCVYVCVSCPIVSDSLQPHRTRQAPLSMEFSRQEYWNGLLFPSQGDLPYLGIEPGSGKYPGEGNGNPLQRSCLEKSHGQRSLAGYGP